LIRALFVLVLILQPCRQCRLLIASFSPFFPIYMSTMGIAYKSSIPKLARILHVLSFYYSSSQSSIGCASADILYSDGKSHSLNTSLDDTITLRASSTLNLSYGDYTIRSPSGIDSAIRLSMSSILNATGGDIIGGDAEGDHPPGAGVIVGSASRADFYDGVTVRGGSAAGQYYSLVEEEDVDDSSSRIIVDGVIEMATMANDNFGRNYNANNKDHGGDALISQYFGSNVTIHGGTFIAGKGNVKDGHSLHAFDEGQIYVNGGNFHGSWMARGRGSIVVTGCLSRIGTRIVGRLQDGLSLDVQLIEEGGGEITVNHPEKCNTYRKPHFSQGNVVGVSYYALFGVIMLCWEFAAV